MYNQRDIVLVKFPFTNLTNSKLRPALIISNEKINNTRDYIFMMITSSPLVDNFIELKNDMLVIPFKPRNGESKKSYLYGKKISTLDETLIKCKISELKEEHFNNVFNLVCNNIKQKQD